MTGRRGSMESFIEDCARRHAESVAKGNHEQSVRARSACDAEPYGQSGDHLPAHVPLREAWRLAKGRTTLPGPIEWRPPICPDCDEDLDNDGDSWDCDHCHVSWDSSGETAEWTDDYGDLGTAPS